MRNSIYAKVRMNDVKNDYMRMIGCVIDSIDTQLGYDMEFDFDIPFHLYWIATGDEETVISERRKGCKDLPRIYFTNQEMAVVDKIKSLFNAKRGKKEKSDYKLKEIYKVKTNVFPANDPLRNGSKINNSGLFKFELSFEYFFATLGCEITYKQSPEEHHDEDLYVEDGKIMSKNTTTEYNCGSKSIRQLLKKKESAGI